MKYLQFFKHFCEIEGVSAKWYDESIRAWRRGAQKLKSASGFKYTGKTILFTWEWIKKFVVAFDRQTRACISHFILVCWAFLLPSLSLKPIPCEAVINVTHARVPMTNIRAFGLIAQIEPT